VAANKAFRFEKPQSLRQQPRRDSVDLAAKRSESRGTDRTQHPQDVHRPWTCQQLQEFVGSPRAALRTFLRSAHGAFYLKLVPDVHRELHRVHVMGNLVAVELSIRGTFSGVFESPAGVIKGNGAKLDTPAADFWYVEDGKIKEFNCHVGVSIMLGQMGLQPDFAAAVKAQG